MFRLGEKVGKPLPKGDAGVDKVLLDPCDASPEAIARYKSLDAEVLCIIVPGHCCPDPPTCSGTVSVPVKHRATDASHLLAACSHNVGQTDAEPYFGDEAKVEVVGMVCCSLTMYREYATPEECAQACRAPVRTVIEAFRSSGVVNAVQHAWGRSFRLGTRPSASERADSFQFYGKPATASGEWVQPGFHGAQNMDTYSVSRLADCMDVHGPFRTREKCPSVAGTEWAGAGEKSLGG